MSTYILPTLIKYKDFDELKNDKLSEDFEYPFYDKNKLFSIDDFFNDSKRYFVLGEPGVGKSRLLKAIQVKGRERKIAALVVDLPQINHTKISEIVSQFIRKESLKDKIVTKQGCTIYFDALDEVNSDKFEETLNSILRLGETKKDLRLVVACRSHYLKKILDLNNRSKHFSFIIIKPFSDLQINNYLQQNIKNVSGTKLNSLFKLTTYNRNSNVIRIARYLEVVISLAHKTDFFSGLKHLKRTDLFEMFIYKKLEEKSIKQSRAEITKRVTEKLALIMEIFQVNSISRDELLTFLDEADSNINLIFLNDLDLKDFIKRVLKETDFNEIAFDNTEFQEYLAAKELLRLGNKTQVLYDLIIEPNFKHIYTNWFDVLKYVIEIDGKQLLTIIDYLFQSTDRLIAEELFSLLAVADITQFSDVEKSKIFETTFMYFQENNIYLSSKAYSLPNYYTSSNNDLLQSITFSDEERIRTSNKLFLIAESIKNKRYEKSADLIKTIKKGFTYLFSNYNRNVDIVISCLIILGHDKSLNDIKAVKKYFTRKGDHAFKLFALYTLIANPDNNFSIEIIIEGIKSKNEDSVNWLNRLNEPKIIKLFLKKLVQNDEILINLISIRDYGYTNATIMPIFRKIEENWNLEFLQILRVVFKSLIKNCHYYDLNRSSFFISLLKTLLGKNNQDLKAFFDLKLISFYYAFIPEIASVLTVKNLSSFRGLTQQPLGKNLFASILVKAQVINPITYTSILNGVSQIYPDFYKDFQKKIKSITQEFNASEFVLNEFRNEMGNDLFKACFYFINNYEVLINRANLKDLNRLRKYILNCFSKADLSKVKIKIDYLSDKQYLIENGYFVHYPKLLKAALLLQMKNDILKFRNFFISLIPILYDKDDDFNFLNNIKDAFGSITSAEYNVISVQYLKREDDLLRLVPGNLIEFIKENKRVEMLPIAKSFLKNGIDTRIDINVKQQSLICIAELDNNSQYLELIFNKSIDDLSTFSLAEIANEYLITKYSNLKAFNWRIEEIKKRKFPLIRNYHSNGPRPYPEKEQELERMTFAKCIIEKSELTFKDAIDDLLDFSFQIRNEDKYFEYSHYLQKIVYNYYLGLKRFKDISVLKSLTDYISKSNRSQKNSFRQNLRNLEIEYSNDFLKPRSFIDAIKKYNEIKSKNYLPVYNENDLLNLLKFSIQEDIVNFIQHEGYYDSFNKPTNKIVEFNEAFVQKTLKIQIENSLLKRGIRKSDIYREPQSASNLRPDFIISYSFIGPIVLELKFITNEQIKNESKRINYKKTLENSYQKGFNCKYGIYCILIKSPDDNDSLKREKIINEYKDLKHWHILFLECYKLN